MTKIFTSENSSPAEVLFIKQRISVFKEQIIWMDELPKSSAYSTRLMFDIVEEKAADWDHFYFIVDISNSSSPDVLTRKAIKEGLKKIKEKLKQVTLITGKNFLVNAAIHFVLSGIDSKRVTVFKKKEAAINHIEGCMGINNENNKKWKKINGLLKK